MFPGFLLYSVVSILPFVLSQIENGPYYGATDIAPDPQDQPWNFDEQYRCRLFSHQSIILKNQDHHLLVFDGGIAKFRSQYQGRSVEVLDLNSYTAVVDLSKRFNTNNFEIMFQVRKTLDVPVTTRFSLWTDSNQDSILMQGGHFYGTGLWNHSSYFITKPKLPPYSIWKFELGSKKWSNVTSAVDMKANFIRAVGGAGLSVPRLNTSFYIGGIQTPRSDRAAPELRMIPQSGMMMFDHNTSTLTNESYGPPGNQMAYWHGSLNHLSIGQGKGFLISLMGEMAFTGVPREDLPFTSNKHGDPVSFEYVMLYNIETKQWINQTTMAWEGSYPIPRSRFCAQVAFSRETRTWELWMYGGMLINPLGDPVHDVFVLTMPSFIWVKVQVSDEGYSRAHSCEVVGSQMLVVGGYPPGKDVEKNVTCVKELIRIFDLNTITWMSEYRLGTEYRTHDVVRERAGFHLNPISPAAPGGWADDTGALEAAFKYGPNPPPPSSPSPPPWGDPTPPSTPGLDSTHNLMLFLILVLIIPVEGGAILLYWLRRNRVEGKEPHYVPLGERGFEQVGYYPTETMVGEGVRGADSAIQASELGNLVAATSQNPADKWPALFADGKTDIRFDDVNPGGFSNEIKGSIENFIGVRVNWWPLSARRKTLPEGFSRVGWRCRCGKRLSDIVSTARKARYEQWRSACSGGLPAQVARLSPMDQEGDLGSAATSANSNDTSVSPPSHQNPSCANGTGPGGSRSGQNPITNERYLLWCINSGTFRQRLGRRCPTVVRFIRIAKNDKDKQVFNNLREMYRQTRGFWGRVSLFEIDEIRYVRFKKFRWDRVTCYPKQELPDPRDREYEYCLPKDEQPEIPPIPVEELMEYFNDPSCAGTLNTATQSFPKKLNGKIANTAWGLYACEQLSFFKVLLLLGLVLAGTLAFVPYWLLRHPGDLQNAFVPPLFFLALAGVFVEVSARCTVVTPQDPDLRS